MREIQKDTVPLSVSSLDDGVGEGVTDDIKLGG